MKRSLLALAAAAVTLSACEGFREAMTAHVDVAARAGTQQLTVERLATLMARPEIPQTAEAAGMIADLWVNYQLLGHAAARGDTLPTDAEADSAMWPMIAQARMARWHERVMNGMTGLDTVVNEARYLRGDQLAAQHILLLVPEGQPQARDSVRRRTEQLRAQVTGANFAELARRHSQDPGSAQRGGELGVFPRGVMVPQFEQAVLSLQPGEISPIVETQFGFHIIRRQPLDEVRAQFGRAVVMSEMQRAESTWIAGLERGYDVKYKPNAVSTVRRAVEDPDASLRSRTVVATSRSGDLTAGRLARWVAALPQREQIRQGVAAADDSSVMELTKRVLLQELVLHQADSARLELEAAEIGEVRDTYRNTLRHAWNVLGISPAALADSAGTPGERDRMAAQTIERYMDSLMAQQVEYLNVPGMLQVALREKYTWRITPAGIQRAMEIAQRRRAEADSLARASRPATQVPIEQQGRTGQEQDD